MVVGLHHHLVAFKYHHSRRENDPLENINLPIYQQIKDLSLCVEALFSHPAGKIRILNKKEQVVSPARRQVYPRAAPSEGPESAGEVSVVPESPPGPSQQASPSAEHRPAPGQGQRRSHQRTATDPQLEVSEQRLRVEERQLELQERALATCQEAWRAFMQTFERIVEHLAPHAMPPAALTATPTAVPPPSATLGPVTEGDLAPADTSRPYLPVHPAPTQPQPGLRPRRGSRPPTLDAGH
ncbi:uncharacterized protein LOC142008333 [Carettochelys insculpta]|uniref:uncharacterized protein LOC142008333 n=1 Tax=Carettochelys insculpta TaxID=44489 RepID=UPI003EBF606B